MAQQGKNLPAVQERQEMWVWSLGWKDPLEEENGNPLQYSCLKNPMDRGAWWATVHGVTKDLTEQLSKQAKVLQVLLPIKKISLQTCFLKCE